MAGKKKGLVIPKKPRVKKEEKKPEIDMEVVELRNHMKSLFRTLLKDREFERKEEILKSCDKFVEFFYPCKLKLRKFKFNSQTLFEGFNYLRGGTYDMYFANLFYRTLYAHHFLYEYEKAMLDGKAKLIPDVYEAYKKAIEQDINDMQYVYSKVDLDYIELLPEIFDNFIDFLERVYVIEDLYTTKLTYRRSLGRTYELTFKHVENINLFVKENRELFKKHCKDKLEKEFKEPLYGEDYIFNMDDFFEFAFGHMKNREEYMTFFKIFKRITTKTF